MINRVVSVLAAVAALVEGIANPGNAVPARVQPYLVLAGGILVAVERCLVYLEAKPDPAQSMTTALEALFHKLPVLLSRGSGGVVVPPTPPVVPPTPPTPPTTTV